MEEELEKKGRSRHDETGGRPQRRRRRGETLRFGAQTGHNQDISLSLGRAAASPLLGLSLLP